MGNLIINKVSYIGDKFYYNSPEFTKGLNIIEGENGNGKSTFINLIYYCLGGDVDSFNPKKKNVELHVEITGDTNNYIELNVTLNSFETYILRRSIGKNFITISDSSGKVESFSINRTENPIIFSDWILNKLNIRILDVFQGNTAFKLNIKDLFRLIYHDQNPDPRRVFKRPDNESYISDSEYVRKLIFRILLGKTFEEYYQKLGDLKKVESEKKLAESLLSEFKQMSIQLYGDQKEVLNAGYLKDEISELSGQLARLAETRNILKITRPKENDASWKDIDGLKNNLMNIEIEFQQIREGLNSKHQELFKYEKYKSGIVREVTQLNKIIHAHETLEVFSSNSCPFCLGTLDREVDHCYCGNSIEEESFEKFFFNSEEYWSLLKSRKKSVETAEIVIISVKEEIEKLEISISDIMKKRDDLKINLNYKLSKIDRVEIDTEKLNQLDDTSLEVKNKIADLNKKLEFEEKLESYRERFSSKNATYESVRKELKILETQSDIDMSTVVQNFNVIYNELMTSTLKDCRNAGIDSDTYEPVIDGGVYREASSRVATRLNYYLAILLMAIKDTKVKHPRFLLIDTPQTAGIDPEQMENLIGQMKEFPADGFQVILTTGHGLYPDNLTSKVKDRLTDHNKLLKRR